MIVHVVVITLFSLGYLTRTIFGEATKELTKEQQLDAAVREGTIALREIAERYDNVTVQELTDQFTSGAKKAATTTTVEPDLDDTSPAEDETEEPLSDIEKKLQEKEKGPAVPDLSAEGEDDLFTPQAP